MRLAAVSVPLILSAVACVGPAAHPVAQPHPWVALEGSVRSGRVNGFLQTPAGGNPGSTSPRRPRLHELSIDDAMIPDGSIALGWGDRAVFAGIQELHRRGSARLSDPLSTQGMHIPSGTLVDVDVGTDVYRLGYRQRIGPSPGAAPAIALLPSAGFSVWHFKYEMRADGDPVVRRIYSKAAPFVGFAVEWTPVRRLALAADASGTLPVFSAPLLVQVEATCGWWLVGDGDRGLQVFVGTGYDWIDHEDRQRVPNHIEIAVGPTAVAGIRARY